uniref:protein S100-A8-like n=1 Tax=Epinephelus lanceolatus TaxID=310571 RepID=UPI001447392A|nr:protein S100-A8-like [Epinephelus lanceolatus]
MSRIADAMDLLMTTFHNYTGPQGNYITLTKNDFTKLLHEEFPEVDYSSDDMESFFSKLDANGDNAVSFKEFVDIITEFDLICTSK